MGGPAWAPRLLWGAAGAVAGFVIGFVLLVTLVTPLGRGAALFAFRVFAYSGVLVGIDFGGERPRLKRALLRGFALGTAIALLRSALSFL